jgi:hypothetical protein
MKKWIFILLIAMLSASCERILKSKPAGTLSEEQMTSLLVDIHLTEATLRIANDSIARLNDTTDLRMRYAQVFRKHDINPDEFNSSLSYYLKHIEVLENIYTEVIARLSKMESTLQQKTTMASFGKMNRGQTKPNMAQLKNTWFRTLYNADQPLEIQYFEPARYPVE